MGEVVTLKPQAYVEPHRPIIAWGPRRGFCFSDTWGLSTEQVNAIAERGIIYLTQFEGPDGRTYGGHILAPNREAADALCSERELGETVYGILAIQIPLGEA